MIIRIQITGDRRASLFHATAWAYQFLVGLRATAARVGTRFSSVWRLYKNAGSGSKKPLLQAYQESKVKSNPASRSYIAHRGLTPRSRRGPTAFALRPRAMRYIIRLAGARQIPLTPPHLER